MSKQVFRTTLMGITTFAVVLSLIGILTVSTPLLGQGGNGVIRGVVRDANQAVVPGAAVTATNELTNVTHKTQSNEVGIYYLGSVPRGSYTLTTELTGFKKWSSKVELQVGQTAVVDVALELGSVETVVDVVSTAPPITTESVEISDVKDYQRIRQLPLNGRDVANLFNLTPGVEGGGNARVNGLKVGSLEITQDGASIVDRFGGGIERIRPGLDTVQEFRIETIGSSAQYSRPATVTLVTRSGTNEFHGSVFETHRNNAWGLRTRQRQDGDTAAKLIRNEYGASAGGPIRKDKTFFFGAYEANKQRQTSFNSRSDQIVPTDAIWGGDFSGLADINGNQWKIYDPLTTDANGVRQPFPNNRIPDNRISPFYKKLRTITAKPTNSNNPFQGPNIERFYPNKGDQYSYTGKVDHKFTDKDNVSVRYTRSNRVAGILGGVYGNPVDGLEDAFGSQQSITKIYTTAIQYNRIFSPTFLNELVASSHRSNQQQGTRADDTNWPNELGFPNPFGATGWPTFYACDGPSSNCFDWDGDNRGDQKLTSHVAEDNLTWIKGKHSLKFGGKVRFEYDNIRELQQAQGSHDFDPNWTALYDAANDQAAPYTGSGTADMALGLFSVIRNQYNRGYYYFEQQEIGLYAHDNWKVTPRLTLDLGVRWDNWRPYQEKYNRLVNVDIDHYANTFEVITPKNVRMEDMQGIPPGVLDAYRRRGLTWRTAEQAGFPSNLYAADNNNFGPRLGAAFRVTDKTVLRGGYGEYFWTMPLAQILQGSRTNAPLNLRYVNSFTNPLPGTDPLYALKNVPSEGVYVGKAAIDLATGSVAPGALGFRAQDARGWKDGRAQSWHLTLEREVLPNTALRLSYIGDHGSDLEQNLGLNAQVEYTYVARTKQAPPGNRDLMRVNKDWEFGGTKTRTGYSNTNSAQVELERRYSKGMAFQVFYTFTRSLTTSDAGGFTNGGGTTNPNATDGQGSIPENISFFGEPNLSYDDRLRVLYHNSTNVPAHRVRYNGIFDLPFGNGKTWGKDLTGVLNQVLGGWQVATIGEWRGGLWGSVDSTRFLQGDPTLSPDQRSIITFQGRPQRIWFKGDFSLTPDDRSQRVLRPLGSDFSNRLPIVLANGTTRLTPVTNVVNPNARAFYQGPGAWNTDFSLFKNFKINESMNVRFTADFFNVFNHPNNNGPGQPGFNVTTGLQDLSTQQNDPRIIQFSLRFDF
jgi:hypothetical protein